VRGAQGEAQAAQDRPPPLQGRAGAGRGLLDSLGQGPYRSQEETPHWSPQEQAAAHQSPAEGRRRGTGGKGQEGKEETWLTLRLSCSGEFEHGTSFYHRT